MDVTTGHRASLWRFLPILFFLAFVGVSSPGCVPGGPLALDDVTQENGSDGGDSGSDTGGDSGGSGGWTAPSVAQQGLAGSTANYDHAPRVTLRSYDHPGGQLIIFVRHGGAEIRDISSTFRGTPLPLLASAAAGARDSERAGYLFAADLEAGQGDIVVELAGDPRRQRGIMAFSVENSAGVRATAARGEPAPGTNGTVNLTVSSREDDLVLGYVAWLFSAADVDSQSSGQSTELDDEVPTRQQAHSKRGAAGTTSLNVRFAGDPSSTVYLAVALEPLPR